MASQTLKGSNDRTAAPRISSDAALELESQLVRETQQQLRQTVSEIAQLAQLPISVEEFINGFLPRVSSAMFATGACVWRFKNEWQLIGNLALPDELLADSSQVQINRETQPSVENGSTLEKAVRDNLESMQSEIDGVLGQIHSVPESTGRNTVKNSTTQRPSLAHQKLLDRVAQERQPILVPPRGIVVSSDRPGNPIESTIILAPAPFESDQETYWLEVISRPIGGPATQRGYLRFVAQMADLLGEHLKSSRLRALERDQALFWECGKLIDEISQSPNQTKSLRKLTETVRGLSSADQVFLIAKSASTKWRVFAASGLDSVDPNSDGFQALSRMAEYFSEHSKDKSNTWKLNRVANSIDPEPIATVDYNHNAMVESAIVLAAKRIDWLRLDNSLANNCAAGLLVIWSEELGSRVDPKITSVARIVLDTTRPAWWQRIRFSETPQSLTGRLIRPWSWSRPSRIVIACLFVLAVLSLPFPMNIATMATIHPSRVQHVFAPSNAIVRNLLVDYGQSVAENDVLVELEDSQLAASLDQATGELVNKEHRLNEVQAILRRGETATPTERDQLESEAQSLGEQVAISQKRLQLLTDQQEHLIVRAKLSGVVGTWDARKLLIDRPVQAGQLLLSLHDPSQVWCVEADFPERDIQSFIRSLRSDQATFAQVQLTSHPNLTINAKFDSIDQQTYTNAITGKNVVRARFLVPADQLPMRNQGAAARVHVLVGTRPLAWVLASDFVMTTWARIRMWL